MSKRKALSLLAFGHFGRFGHYLFLDIKGPKEQTEIGAK
jgi:hypothetical protein